MEALEIRGNKTVGDLVREAGRFVLHTLVAVLAVVGLLAVFSSAHADADSPMPKYLFTALAFVVPMMVGFLVSRFFPDNVAGYVWISGLLFFLIVCVYTLDLPTGAGLCNGCGAVDKLWRTFFSIDHGSGLLGGDGLVWGAWFPLAMIGYAVGAQRAVRFSEAT